MDNSFGLAVACILGLIVGGALSGFFVTFLQQLSTGRVRLPPNIALGPIRLDLSGLMPPISGAPRPADASGVAPLLEGGSSLTGGCLAVISAGMVLVGFVLPWFTCNLPLLSGSVSGLSALIQLGFGLALAFAGAADSRLREINTLSGLVFLVLLVVAVVIILAPLMGWRIGREGLEMIRALRSSNAYRRSVAQTITRSAVIGLAPLLCYFSTTITNFNLPSVPGLGSGLQLQTAGIGLWITMSGFGLALVAGLVISIAVSLAEQIPRPPTGFVSASPPPAEVKPPAVAHPQPPPNVCPNCGTSFQPGDQFCTACGLRFNG